MTSTQRLILLPPWWFFWTNYLEMPPITQILHFCSRNLFTKWLATSGHQLPYELLCLTILKHQWLWYQKGHTFYVTQGEIACIWFHLLRSSCKKNFFAITKSLVVFSRHHSLLLFWFCVSWVILKQTLLSEIMAQFPNNWSKNNHHGCNKINVWIRGPVSIINSSLWLC